jgi:hypothetical protein
MGPQADDSPALDLVTVFQSAAGASNEMEALAVEALLKANGIDAMIIGNSALPNLAEEVRVPREDAPRAQQIIAEALAAGPAAAREAEASEEAEDTGRSG